MEQWNKRSAGINEFKVKNFRRARAAGILLLALKDGNPSAWGMHHSNYIKSIIYLASRTAVFELFPWHQHSVSEKLDYADTLFERNIQLSFMHLTQVYFKHNFV